jgi:polysaccharide export outer membrane protein
VTVRRCFVALLLLLPVFARAQDPEESLLIGPGDLIAVRVFDTDELNQSVRVSDSGDIKLSVGSIVHVAGMSPPQASHLIETALIKDGFMLQPHVQVSIEQYANSLVTVLGEVKLPGTYTINTPRNILTVLAQSGGLTEFAKRTVTIQRHATKDRIPYTLSNDPNEALDHEPMVFPGDTVLVPRVDVVYVLGDVGRPGGYAKVSSSVQISVLEAVSLAGATQPSAVPSKARLIRRKEDGTYITINLPLSN